LHQFDAWFNEACYDQYSPKLLAEDLRRLLDLTGEKEYSHPQWFKATPRGEVLLSSIPQWTVAKLYQNPTICPHSG